MQSFSDLVDALRPSPKVHRESLYLVFIAHKLTFKCLIQGPGLFFILPCTDNIVIVDLRTVTFDVEPQEILTKDSVTVKMSIFAQSLRNVHFLLRIFLIKVTVDAVVYFRIFNSIASVINVANANMSTRLLAATTLRNILGMKTLQEILQDREHIAHQVCCFILSVFINFDFKLKLCFKQKIASRNIRFSDR